MKFQAYVGVTGEEAAVRAFSAEANLNESRLRPLAPGGDPQRSRSGLWLWRTRRVAISPDEPELGLENLVRSHLHLAATIKKHRRSLAEVVVNLIAQSAEGESPRTYTFSEQLIQMLAQFGAALTVDAVSVMGDPD